MLYFNLWFAPFVSGLIGLNFRESALNWSISVIKIVIPDDYQDVVRNLECFSLLKDFNVSIFNDTAEDINELARRFAGADCIVLTRERTKITREIIDKLPGLKLISQTGKVAAHVNVEACTKNGIAISEGKGSPVAPAELTWTLIMAGMRKLVPAINDMKNGRWQTNIGDCLEGKKLGIWGFGKIGKKIAGYGRAFGMNVIVWGSENSRTEAANLGYTAARSRDSFFEESDVVTVQLRLRPETTGIIDFSDLNKMKNNALFVNTSRAELVEPGALERALKNGRPGRAALDVYETEPVYDKNFWALKMDNVLCTPHLGYVENHGYEYYFGQAFQNIVDFFNGNPVNILNPEVLKT